MKKKEVFLVGILDFLKGLFIPEEEKHKSHSQILSGTIPPRYIVFDIETTGLSRQNDRIIEIAANEYTDGKVTRKYHTYVNPCCHIPNAITRLTGIRDFDVSKAPTIHNVKTEVLQFFGSTTLVGHNINAFDIPFLEAQFGCIIRNRRIDTLPLAKQSFPGLPNYKLFTLDQVLELGGLNHHRAENDIAVNNALLLACASPQKYRKRLSDPKVLNSIILEEKRYPYQKIDIHSFQPSNSKRCPHTPLAGKNIVFSGEFSILREEMCQIAVDAGATLKSQVSRKVDYLVLGMVDDKFLDENGMSSKQRTARKLNSEGCSIKVIGEKEFLRLANHKK